MKLRQLPFSILVAREELILNPQSFQQDPEEGWNFDDDSVSRAAVAGGGLEREWADKFKRPDSPVFSRWSYHPSIDPSNSPEDWQGTVA
jgi:hypothetical protein